MKEEQTFNTFYITHYVFWETFKFEISKEKKPFPGPHYDITAEFEEQIEAGELMKTQRCSIKLLAKPENFKPVLIVLGLLAFQQLVGINALTFNLATIFSVSRFG